MSERDLCIRCSLFCPKDSKLLKFAKLDTLRLDASLPTLMLTEQALVVEG